MIYKYLLSSLILTFPICSEDNRAGMCFLGSTLKGLAASCLLLEWFSLWLGCLLIFVMFVQITTTTTNPHTRSNASGFGSAFLGGDIC